MKRRTEADLFTDQESNDFGEYLRCPNCYYSLDTNIVVREWNNLPAGVKFDPTDIELLDHLAAKCGEGSNLQPNNSIDHFITTLQGEGGICCTHPENLPGTKKDGSNAYYFYKSMNAYANGRRKRRKIQSEECLQNECVRWHKTGNSKPLMENGLLKGYKKILVLYTVTKGYKSVKCNWVMHEYHLGTDDHEKEGEFVVSKVFYQQKHVKKVDYPISVMDSIHSYNGTRNKSQQENSNTNNYFEDVNLRTPAEELELIEGIPQTCSSGSRSIFETYVSSWPAAIDYPGETRKPSSTWEAETISGNAAIPELEDIVVDTPPDFNQFADLFNFPDGPDYWSDFP